MNGHTPWMNIIIYSRGATILALTVKRGVNSRAATKRGAARDNLDTCLNYLWCGVHSTGVSLSGDFQIACK